MDVSLSLGTLINQVRSLSFNLIGFLTSAISIRLAFSRNREPIKDA
jgi:hypothetical protein